MSMAASEYVSVHSLTDYEQADLQRKRVRIKTDRDGAHAALVASYLGLGLDAALAKQVADQLMSHGAVGAYARDELLISPARRARPNQAAFASAGSFALGASMPVLIVLLAPRASLIACVSAMSLISLALLGAWAARTGGASVIEGAVRVTFWGALAMVLTAAVGTLFGTVV
jgi:VIT1/CCC1 family predicted Fe2+/Mn2+ transporter